MMDQLKRPDKVDVEKAFNQFIIASGGQLIQSILTKQADTANADYFFDNPIVIAELKCFQKDLFNNEEDIPRFFDYFKKWKDKKLLDEGDELKVIFGTKTLPNECWSDLINAALRTIETAIRKANKQIRETKKLLNKPDAKGLLFLCNDGNYFLQNNEFISLICRALSKKTSNSHVDGFVYFTFNQASRIQGNELDLHLWVPGYEDGDNNELSLFVDKLGGKFFEYLKKISSNSPTTHIQFDSINDAKDMIEKMRYIPKEIIYKGENK